MEPETFSRTALMAALIRAIHAKHHSPKIFEDPFAAQLLNDDDREFCESVMFNALKEHAPSVDIDAIGRDVVLTKVVSMIGALANVLSRARYAEDKLQSCPVFLQRPLIKIFPNVDFASVNCYRRWKFKLDILWSAQTECAPLNT